MTCKHLRAGKTDCCTTSKSTPWNSYTNIKHYTTTCKYLTSLILHRWSRLGQIYNGKSFGITPGFSQTRDAHALATTTTISNEENQRRLNDFNIAGANILWEEAYALAEFLFIAASHSTRKRLPSCLWHKQALSSLMGRIGLCVYCLLKFSVACVIFC